MRNGQSLIEVVVAMAVVAALAVALVTTGLVTQKASRSAENNTQATKLVQQNIEQIRAFRDRKGFSALTNGACWIIDTSSGADPTNWTLTNTAPCPRPIVLNQTTFNRSLSIQDGTNTNQKTVVVTVTWTDSGGVQTVSNSTLLSSCVNNTTAPPSPCL